MELFDNITRIVRDDMATGVRRGSKISVAASYFSIYAYKVLKKQLEPVDTTR